MSNVLYQETSVNGMQSVIDETLKLIPGIEKASPVPAVQASDLKENVFKKEWISRNRPVVIRGAIKHWPGVQKWKDKEYWKAAIPDFKTNIYTHQNYNNPKHQETGKEEMLFHDAIDRLFADKDYIFSIPGRKITEKNNFAPLIKDTPGFAFLPDPAMPRFHPRRRVFLYRRAATAWHYHDIDETLMCQVNGTKRIAILPPGIPQVEKITQFFIDDAFLEGASIDRSLNLSPFIVDVHEGDSLYIPPYWHHGVVPVDGNVGFTIAYCWRSPLHIMGDKSNFFVKSLYKSGIWPSGKAKLLAPLYKSYAGLQHSLKKMKGQI